MTPRVRMPTKSPSPVRAAAPRAVGRRLTVLLLLASASCSGPQTASPYGEPAGSSGSADAGAGGGGEDAPSPRIARLAGKEAASLDRGALQDLQKIAEEQPCPCPDVRDTLGGCALSGSCPRAPFALRSAARGLQRREKPQSISARLLERYGPMEPEEVETSGAPCRGREGAPVVLVVFSDFQCPFCALGRKLVEELQREAGEERLRVCFKHWPLTRIHKQALLAAQAAVAAQEQGKFWPMHDRLFDHHEDLDHDDLLEHAEAVGLDPERFKQDLDSPRTRARVALDVAEANRLKLRGTPSFLINGKVMTDPKSPQDFMDWIEEAALEAKEAKK